jgi:hypothetical protein
MDLIPTPPWSHEKMREYFNLAMTDALAHGLTSIHDAGSTADSIEFFRKQVLIDPFLSCFAYAYILFLRLAEDGDIPVSHP